MMSRAEYDDEISPQHILNPRVHCGHFCAVRSHKACRDADAEPESQAFGYLRADDKGSADAPARYADAKIQRRSGRCGKGKLHAGADSGFGDRCEWTGCYELKG